MANMTSRFDYAGKYLGSELDTQEGQGLQEMLHEMQMLCRYAWTSHEAMVLGIVELGQRFGLIAPALESVTDEVRPQD